MIQRLCLVVFVALMAWPAAAQEQQLLETEGVELLEEAQLVMSGGGTCNVLESDTAYEARRENDGAPMDIWQLDFSVRNGSGRWLDHLIARFQIESEWPECTNWDGPDAGTFQPLEWADSIDFIQESGRNVVGPDETLTETKYFIVLQGDPPPRFSNWSVDFDFAVNPPPAGTATGASGSRSAQQAVVATPEQETLFWQSIADSTNPAVFEAYLAQFPNGVFRTLAQVRLAELRVPVGDVAAAGGPRGGGDGAPTAAAGRVASTPADAPMRAGETRVFDGMEFVWVPAGEFRMGSEVLRASQPVTQVRISRGFWLGKHEVTQSEWQVAGATPSRFSGCGQCPVEYVSWNDAQEFIGSLNGRSGGNRYRLPTEAEWEYAARAGTTGARYGNLDAIAWYGGNNVGGGPKPVGQKAANAWGLHDMIGNVWEWVEDWRGAYPGGVVTDPLGPASGSQRVLRGCDRSADAVLCRASLRNSFSPGFGNGILGFRLLRTE